MTIEFLRHFNIVFVVQLLSCVQPLVTPWTAGHQASLSFTISWSLLKLMSIESVMPSNHLVLCCPLLLLPQSFPESGSFPMSWLFASWIQTIIGFAPCFQFHQKLRDFLYSRCCPRSSGDWISVSCYYPLFVVVWTILFLLYWPLAVWECE